MRRVVVSITVVLLAACGSEGRAPSRTPEPSSDRILNASPGRGGSRAAFVRDVNAACKAYAERDEALASPEDLDSYVPFMRQFIANSAALDARLGALRVPDGIEGFGDYVAANKRQTAILRAALPKVEAAVAEGDAAEADIALEDAIDAFNDVVDELDPYAKRYGFTECAGGDE